MPSAPKLTPPFKLQPPNDDIHEYGGELRQLRHSRITGVDQITPGRPIFWAETAILGSDEQWLSARWLQAMCAQDSQLQSLLEKAHRSGYNTAILSRVRARIGQIFEQQMLPKIIESFDEILPMVADFFAAKYAHQQTFPDETPS